MAHNVNITVLSCVKGERRLAPSCEDRGQQVSISAEEGARR